MKTDVYLNFIFLFFCDNSVPKMARRSRRIIRSPNKVAPKTLLQKLNSKTKISTKSRKPMTKKQKVVEKQNSPRLFEDDLQSMYQKLQYPHDANSDSMKSRLSGTMKNAGSIDLFETESAESLNQINKIPMISIGIQCSLDVKTRDIGVGTDSPKFQDSGIQTSPFKIQSKTKLSNLDEDDILSEESDSTYTEDESSDDIFKNFDALEHLHNEAVYEPNIEDSDKEAIDDSKTIINVSPPRNQIYINRSFHSPESLRVYVSDVQPPKKLNNR